MKLILGLGNPGKEYQATRHNIGFMAIDALATTHNVKLTANKKLLADISRVNLAGSDVLLAKPRLFTNESGQAVAKISQFYNLKPDDIIIIHDDLDLALGTVKYQYNRGAAGHHGVESIRNHLGTKSFYRVRCGIGRSINHQASQYVLDKFNIHELEQWPQIYEQIQAMLFPFLTSAETNQKRP